MTQHINICRGKSYTKMFLFQNYILNHKPNNSTMLIQLFLFQTRANPFNYFNHHYIQVIKPDDHKVLIILMKLNTQYFVPLTG